MGHNKLHATEHTDGTDDIPTATAAVKGLMSAAAMSKLDGIETGATKSTFTEQIDCYIVSDTKGNDTTGDGSWFNPYKTAQKAVNEGVIAGFDPIGILIDSQAFPGESITLPDFQNVFISSLEGTSWGGGDQLVITIGDGSELRIHNVLAKILEGGLGYSGGTVIIEDSQVDGLRNNGDTGAASLTDFELSSARLEGDALTDLSGVGSVFGIAFDLDNTKILMFSPLDMGGEQIKNMADGTASDDGATFGQIPVQATETITGIAEISTQTETNTGTDDNRIITPLKLANYGGVLSSPQKQKVMQFGGPELQTSGASWSKTESIIFPGTTKMGTPLKIYVNAYRTGGTNYDIRIIDKSNGDAVICSLTAQTNTGEAILDMGALSNLPAGQALWHLQVQKTGGGSARTSGGSIQW